MKLLSLNVATPRPVEHRGGFVQIAMFKRPVAWPEESAAARFTMASDAYGACGRPS
jgi:hypothetical protein